MLTYCGFNIIRLQLFGIEIKWLNDRVLYGSRLQHIEVNTDSSVENRGFCTFRLGNLKNLK